MTNADKLVSQIFTLRMNSGDLMSVDEHSECAKSV